jgi:hypothetical protein
MSYYDFERDLHDLGDSAASRTLLEVVGSRRDWRGRWRLFWKVFVELEAAFITARTIRKYEVR